MVRVPPPVEASTVRSAPSVHHPDLPSYRERDTWAMVKVLGKLQELARG